MRDDSISILPARNLYLATATFVMPNMRPWSKPLVYSVVAAVFILVMNLAVILLVGDEARRIFLIDITYPLWFLLAALGLLSAAVRSAVVSHRVAAAWGMMAVAALASGTGNVIWAVYELGGGSVPYPSLADLCYLLAYPLYLCGVLLLPTERLKPGEWVKTSLDIAIVMMAAALAAWRYLIGPTVAAVSQENVLVQLVALAYPAVGLVLLWATLVLLHRQRYASSSVPLWLLSVAFAVDMVAETIYSFQALTETYVSAGLLDMSWILMSLLVGIAGVWQATQARPHARQESGSDETRWLDAWLAYLPYIVVIAAYIMLEFNEGTEELSGMTWLSWGIGLLILLVLVRQMFTIRENQRQAQTVRQTNHVLQDEIEERKRAEAQLAHDAVHDALTGLPNRVLFMDRLQHAIEFAKRQDSYHFSVLFLDLDHFKVVNDSLGHAVGDHLLIAVTQRLRMCLRTGDTVARLGGDEFVVLLEDTLDGHDAITTAEAIQSMLQQPLHIGEHQLFVAVSIGLIANAERYDNPEDILRDADIAMYQAKLRGKSRYELFNLAMREQAQNRLELERDLRQVLEHNELELFYQPILTLQSDRIVGFEALLRWRHPRRGLIAPNEFIPIAEETGLIIPIGRWVLTEACRQLRQWQIDFPQTPPLTMSVNISAVQFGVPDFINQIKAILQNVELDPTALRLELTESVWLNSTKEALALFQQLSDMGIQLHIDDFGTGYSSLAYLQHFPIRMLKIDRAFLDKMGQEGGSKDIVRTVIAMAHDLGMEAVAEGVETIEQLENLKRFGCDYGQGYLLSRPIDRAGIEQLLAHAAQKPALPPATKPDFGFFNRTPLEQLAAAD